MLTKDHLEAEAKELQDQFGKAQQQVEQSTAHMYRIHGALLMTQKLLEQLAQTGKEAAACPSPNGVAPIASVSP